MMGSAALAGPVDLQAEPSGFQAANRVRAGPLTEPPRPQEQAAKPAGQNASSAPFRITGALRAQAPAEGVAGGAKAAPAQGKDFLFVPIS